MVDTDEAETTEYLRNELVFSFKISKKEWWDKYYRPEARNLSGGWADELKIKFKESKPAGIHCSLTTEGNSVVHAKSPKAKSSSPFIGRMRCNSAQECRMKWFFVIEDFDLFSRKRLVISVFGEGSHKHSSLYPVRANIRGAKRQQLAASVVNSSAAKVKKDLLNEKLSTAKGTADLNAGNFDDVPTNEALRQMGKEAVQKGDLSKDPWTNLKLKADQANAQYGKNSVFALSDLPVNVSWATDNMLDHLYKLNKFLKVLVVSFDSTGALLSPAPWDPCKKQILLYSLVTKLKEMQPIPVAEFLLSDQHEFEVAIFFPRLLQRYQEFVKQKYGSTPKSLPFSVVTIDMSWAMTNSLLKEVVGMSLIEYLKAAMNMKERGMLRMILIAWCYAHFLHAIVRKIGSLVPVKKKKYSPARRTLKFAMAEMARSSNLEDAKEIFGCVFVIYNSKQTNEQVQSSLAQLAARFRTTPEDLCNEEKSHACMEDPKENPDFEIYIPEDDRACSSLHQTYRDSPFYMQFREVARGITLEGDDDNAAANPFYVPEVTDYLMRYMLPFYPLWSRYLQALLLPHEENPLTNSAVELEFKLKKQTTWNRKKRHKIWRFLERSVLDAETRIKEFEYPTNFKGYAKKRKLAETQVEASNQEDSDNEQEKSEKDQEDSEESRPPIKKARSEKWKKSSTVRPPHGHYSHKNARKYATKLVKRSQRILTSHKVLKKTVSHSQAESGNADTEQHSVDTTGTDAFDHCTNSTDVKVKQPKVTCNSCLKWVDSACAVIPRDKPTQCLDCFCQEGNRLIKINVDSDEARPACEGASRLTALGPFVTVRKQKKPDGVKTKLDTFTPKYPWEEKRSFPLVSSSHLFSCKGITLTHRDFECLKPGKWLNDAVIDSFLRVISDPDNLKEPEACINILSSVSIENISMGADFVLKAVGSSDKFFSDIWLVPSHVYRNHWILFLVLIKTRKIIILDSLHGDKISAEITEHLQILRLMLADSHMHCFGTAIDWSQWSVYYPPVPSQINGYDCGVFVCVWAYAICTGQPSQSLCDSIANCRAWMGEVLLSKGIKQLAPIKPETSKNSTEEVEFIQKVYQEFDNNTDNVILIQKPWRKLPVPHIQYSMFDGLQTCQVLDGVMSNLWKATDEFCGAPKGCKGVDTEMYRCEACPEYYHLECVGGSKTNSQKAYFCPAHVAVRTKTRVVSRPIRLRKSLT